MMKQQVPNLNGDVRIKNGSDVIKTRTKSTIQHLRTYTEISRIYLKAQLIWRADTMFHMLLTISKIIFAYLLWGVIFEGKELVAGFTFHSMLSYYIISSFLSQIEMSSGISGEISTRIRNGTFSKYMTIPVNPMRYFLAMEIGVVLFNLSFNLVAAVIWIFVFRIQFVITMNGLLILSGIIIILLGLLFMVQLNYFLGILTLKFQEISMFLMIKDNLAALITGAIIPLTLLPETVIQWMKVFPFYYVTYLPSMLLIGRNEEEAVIGIVVMVGWCCLMGIINRITYEKYRVKFDGVGI